MKRRKKIQTRKEENRDIRIKIKDFLKQWDNSSKKQRIVILERFIAYFTIRMTGCNIYQLDKDLGEITPLFFTRIMSSFQMNHMKLDLMLSHIDCIIIYLRSQNSTQYTERFINAGGIQMILNMLQNRKKQCNKNLKYKCLLCVKLIINSNCNFKQIICMNDGIEVLLNIIVDKETVGQHRLLYSLYDLLKQLCIRNDVYTPTIHRLIIEYIQHHSSNDEAVKMLLKVLQCTLSFEDDVRTKVATHQSKNIHLLTNDANDRSDTMRNDLNYAEKDIINENNMKGMLQLLKLQNHQIAHELQNLCNVILRSNKAQCILSRCLVQLMTESDGEIKKETMQFCQSLIHRNMNILNVETKEMLSEYQPNAL